MEERFYEEYALIQDDHWWFVGRRRIFSSILERTLPSPTSDPTRRILDIGCGTGTNLAALGRFGRVVGVDAEPAAVALCRARGWSVELAEGAELPFAAASFDVVTLLDVIEHADDDAVLLAEASRVLVPGGIILVSVPAYTWMWGRQDDIAHHKRRYTRARLAESLFHAGLVTLRMSHFNTLLFVPIAGIRLARRLRPDPSEPVSDFEVGPSGPINRLLASVFGFEGRLLRRVSFPFGVSVIAVATHRSGS